MNEVKDEPRCIRFFGRLFMRRIFARNLAGLNFSLECFFFVEMVKNSNTETAMRKEVFQGVNVKSCSFVLSSF